MDHRPLGAAGTIVSTLCLGTMTFGAESDEPTAHALLDRFVEAGGTFVDTADVYQRGVAEEILGRWLERSGRREDVIVATKGRFPMGEGANQAGLSRRWLRRALHGSLRRLGLDDVDLYQVHCWDPVTPLEETLDALADLVREGLVHHVGLSNFAGWQVQRAALLSRVPIATLQPQYSLLAREIEWEVVPCCRAERIGLLPWSPLGGGWLTGKYARDRPPAGETRLGEDPSRGQEAWDRRNVERTWRVVDAVAEVAGAHGASSAQVALRWVMDRPGVTSTILGARTVAQLEDNLGAADLRLSSEEVARLDEASDPGLPAYPYGFIAEETAPRVAQAGLGR